MNIDMLGFFLATLHFEFTVAQKWVNFFCRTQFLVCPMKHPAVKMEIDGKHSVIPLDDDVSTKLFPLDYAISI